MGTLLIKPGVTFVDPIPPAGQAILGAIKAVAAGLPYDLTITSGSDGIHSGPSDPHHFGNAYDVRSHDLPSIQEKADVLRAVMCRLATHDEEPLAQDGGLVTHCFFGWLEAEGQPNEHFHWQLRHGVTYP